MHHIGIIDYNICNLTSVANAFRNIGCDTEIISDPAKLERCSHMVLPGVGSFAAGMNSLVRSGLDTALRAQVVAGKPLIGLCLGMQLLAEEGEEFGLTAGLALVPGRIVRLRPDNPDLRLPHVGWNDVIRRADSRLLAGIDEPAAFYFVHSFCYHDSSASFVSGFTDYGGPVASVVEHGNVMGVQFHPEKSQKAGLALLRNFVERC